MPIAFKKKTIQFKPETQSVYFKTFVDSGYTFTIEIMISFRANMHFTNNSFLHCQNVVATMMKCICYVFVALYIVFQQTTPNWEKVQRIYRDIQRCSDFLLI